jgi:hypothetical protein
VRSASKFNPRRINVLCVRRPWWETLSQAHSSSSKGDSLPRARAQSKAVLSVSHEAWDGLTPVYFDHPPPPSTATLWSQYRSEAMPHYSKPHDCPLYTRHSCPHTTPGCTSWFTPPKQIYADSAAAIFCATWSAMRSRSERPVSVITRPPLQRERGSAEESSVRWTRLIHTPQSKSVFPDRISPQRIAASRKQETARPNEARASLDPRTKGPRRESRRGTSMPDTTHPFGFLSRTRIPSRDRSAYRATEDEPSMCRDGSVERGGGQGERVSGRSNAVDKICGAEQAGHHVLVPRSCAPP